MALQKKIENPSSRKLIMASKEISELDREIIELETSLKEVKSCLRETWLRKECKEWSDRISKLRRELFTAEQQFQQAKEEGEIRPRVKPLNTQTSECVAGSIRF